MKKVYVLLMMMIGGLGVAFGQNVSATWGVNANPAWYTITNWIGGAYAGVQGAAASNAYIATFATGSTGNPFGINLNTNSLNLGAVSLDNTRTTATNISNSSGAVTANVFRLYGATVNAVPNVIIRNNGSGLLSFQTNANGLPIVLGNTTENIINIDGTGGITINSIISDLGGGAKKLTKAGSGSGVLTLAGVNTYTGGTTITTGILSCGAINTIPSTGTVTFNGGSLRTGSAAGFDQSAGTLSLTDNSNIILGTGVHTLNFANSSAVSWTAAKTLTITGWTGGYNGTTGTGTKIFAGSDATGLTAGQLAQIVFFDGTNNFPATILSTGEVVPAVSGSPVINVSVASLSGFVSLVNPAFSAEQSYTVDGANLTNDITITPPVGFEISLTTGAGFISNPSTLTLTQTGGAVTSKTIYVRLNSATLGANTGDITHTSTGSNDPNVGLTGNVIATEPTIQSAITFGTITNTTIDVNFAGGNGAKRILLIKALVPVDSDPADATTYTPSTVYGLGTQIGTGNYVVYAGTGNSVTVSGLAIGTNYHFAVYEYNDGNVAGAENYLVPGGINDAATTAIPVVYTWIGGSSTWNTAANWLPARIFPASNDILLFLDGTTETVTAVPNESIGQLHVTLGTKLTLQAAVTTTALTINGSIALDDLTVDATSALNIDGVNGYSINLATGTTGLINGTMAFTAGAHRLTAVDASAITFSSGAVFTAGTGFSGNAFGTVNLNSVIFANGSRYDFNAGSNPFGAGQPNSVVVFQTGSLFRVLTSLVVPAFTGRTYANFELDNPSYSSPSTGGAPLSIDNLTVTNGSLNLNLTGGISIKGNISVAAGQSLVFNPATPNTLTFNGTTAQSITNLGTLTFAANEAVTFNNANGITINNNVTLNNLVTFTAGVVTVPNPIVLTLSATASVAGASNASFVSGKVSKIGNSNFVFPVGKTNCGPSGSVPGYAPISISNFSGGTPTDQYTAEYIRSNGSALGTITATGLTKVSACEYWTLNQTAGASTIDVKLSWNEPVSNCTTGSPYINNLPSLVVAHFNGANWDSYGTTLTATGTAAAGEVTWPGCSVFSPFTIGSVDFTNPLPITINYFNGTKSNGNHVLNWKVTCVSTPNATLEMQRSTDGREYNTIYSINATALRCAQPFDYTDAQPAKGINYYRLKMTDAEGKITYSTIVTLINAVKGTDIMNIAPNPVVNGRFDLKISAAEKTQMEFIITDMQGRLLQRQAVSLIAGFNVIPMQVNKLAAGTYQLFGYTDDGRTRVLRFVIQ